MKRSDQVLATRTIDLGYEQMLVLEGQPGASVKVLFGGMWLTEENRDDVFAGPQDRVVLRSRGKAIIQALRTSRIELQQRARAFDGVRDWLGVRAAGAARALQPQRLREMAATLVPRATMMALALVPGLAVFVLALIDPSVH